MGVAEIRRKVTEVGGACACVFYVYSVKSCSPRRKVHPTILALNPFQTANSQCYLIKQSVCVRVIFWVGCIVLFVIIKTGACTVSPTGQGDRISRCVPYLVVCVCFE